MLLAFSSGLVRRSERQHREDGAKDLLLGDSVALGDIREDRGRKPEAALGKLTRRLIKLGSLLDARLNQLSHPVELHLRVDRAEVGVLVERVADADLSEPLLQLCDERLIDRLLHEKSRASAAHVPLVEVDAVDDSLDRLVERRVVEDDVRRLAAELERQPLLACRRDVR